MIGRPAGRGHAPVSQGNVSPLAAIRIVDFARPMLLSAPSGSTA